MQVPALNSEITRRFHYTSPAKPAQEKLTSDKLAAQIAEFEKQGGSIKQIPTGVGAVSSGAVIVSEETHSMAVPRNSQRNAKTTTSSNNPNMTLREAAQYLGKSHNFVLNRIAKGTLKAKKISGCRAHFVSREEVAQLKQSLGNK